MGQDYRVRAAGAITLRERKPRSGKRLLTAAKLRMRGPVH